MALAMIFNVVAYSINPNRWKEFNLGLVGAHVIAAQFSLTSFVFTLTFCKNPDAIQGINEFLKWETMLSARFERRRETIEVIDVLLIIMQLGGSVMSFGVFMSIFFHFDPFYFIFEEFILTNPIFRSNLEILLGLLTRSVIMIGVFECVRTLSFVFYLFAILVNRMGKCADILLFPSGEYGVKLVVKYYSELIVVYRIFKSWFLDFLSILVSQAFWLIVVLCWVMIRGFETVPIYMYLMIVIVGISFIIMYTCLLNLLADLGERCTEAVMKCRRQSRLVGGIGMSRCGKGKRERFALNKETKALHPISISYRSFVNIDKEFLLSLLHTELNRLVDALVMFG
ncbi:unnamed protein product [Orchesella dallaii]|uniref:Gustatory receptor n=1 Tax=Orchesella dallaii TaxID=48710 RepID=A0ABP1PLW5_9HEXA